MENTFYDYFGIATLYENYDDYTANKRAAVIAVYYSFTSLSTVGFGDYHPRSNPERLFVAFILLFGVSIFSYCMGIFI